MRKILMSQKGEFKSQGKQNYYRSTAVKKIAEAIKDKESADEETEVVVSNNALHRKSR